MRKLRFVLFFLAAVLIVGLFPGSYLRGNSQRASFGGGGGGASTTAQEETPKIYCVVEQGDYLYLRPEVWENGRQLTPVDEVTEDEYTYDVYLITPGVAQIRFVDVVQTKAKSGEVKAGSAWNFIVFVGESYSTIHVTSSSTVDIPSDATEVHVKFSHL